LARGLMGEQMKKILMCLGKTNTGKGILCDALQLACGGYVSTFNAENLAYRNTSNDEAQILRWAMLLQYKRIILSNELKTTSDLNGNMIKKIASGGDTLIARGHCKNETEFKTHFLPVIFANDIPNIKPYDDAVDGRLKVISYIKSYVENPTNESELQKDDSIKDEIKTLRFQRCFVCLLLRSYTEGNFEEPDEVKMCKKDWVGDNESDFIEKFKEEFEITNNENNYITSSEIERWIKDKKLGISMKKFSAELKSYCSLRKLDNVYSKVKKICGKSPMAWFGLKHVELDDDELIDALVDELI
jgi:phage/plasmid-associated DNA primase